MANKQETLGDEKKVALMHWYPFWHRKLALVFLALFLAPTIIYSAQTISLLEEADQALKSKDYIRARTLLEQACKEGSAVGCHNLALMFDKGDGGPRDQTRARMFYARACRHGIGMSCFNAGIMYEKGEGGAQDTVRARTFYREACAKRFAKGCEMEKILEELARVEQREKKVEADIKRVDKQIGKVDDRLKEIDQEEKKIRKELGRDVEELQRLKQKEKKLEADLKRAKEEAKEAETKAERADAAYEAAVALKAGDLKRARDLFDQACRAGNSGSCVHLGWMLGSGRGGLRDERRARALLEQGCKAGVAEGCFALGAMFDDGVGGPQDKARARALYDQACKGGHSEACSVLAKPATTPSAGPNPLAVPVDPERGRALFVNGLDAFSAADYPRARSLYEQACQAGSPTGCEYFALMLLGGTGGPQDTAGARELFDRTCKTGHVDSCFRLKNMQKGGGEVASEKGAGTGSQSSSRPGSQESTPGATSGGAQDKEPGVSSYIEAVKAFGARDYERARELYDQACKEGHRTACLRARAMPKTGQTGPQETKKTPEVIAKPKSGSPPTPAMPPAVRAPRPSRGEAAQGFPNPLALLPESTQANHRRCAVEEIAGTYQTVYGPLVCRAGNGGLECCYGSRCEKKAKLTLDQSGQNMVGSWRYPDGRQGPLTFPVSSQCALQSGRWGDAGKNPSRPWTVGRR
jgi:TPR repeat protein